MDAETQLTQGQVKTLLLSDVFHGLPKEKQYLALKRYQPLQDAQPELMDAVIARSKPAGTATRFALGGTELKPDSPFQQAKRTVQRGYGALQEVEGGAFKALGRQAYHATEFTNRGLRVIPGVQGRLPSMPPMPEALKSKTTAEKVGSGIVEAAEFIAASPYATAIELRLGSLISSPSLLKAAKAGIEAGTAGGITALQTGELKSGAIAGGAAFGLSGILQSIPGVKKRLRGAAASAIQWAESKGIPLTFGQRTGQKFVARLEKSLENVPGASGRAQDFYAAQEEALKTEGQGLLTPGRSQTEMQAGEAIIQRKKNVIAGAKAEADILYNDVRKRYTKARVEIQRKTELIEHERPDGTVWTEWKTPPVDVFEAPVNLKGAKNRLKPIYEELTRTMQESKRQSSPGYQALKELMESPDMADAVIVDRNLSALKGLIRKGDNPFLNSRSQGLAREATDALTEDLNRSLNAHDPELLPTLQAARNAVRKQHTVAELLNELPDEPVQLYDLVTRQKDRAFKQLAAINAIASGEVRSLGGTWLEGLIDNMDPEGEMTRAAGAYAKWKNAGVHTKNLFFSNDQISGLDNFFLASKRLSQDINPSGTAKVATALGPILWPAYELAFGKGSIEERAKRVPQEVAAGLIGMSLLSRVLLTEGGAKALTAIINAPSGSPGFRQGVNALASVLPRLGQEEKVKPKDRLAPVPQAK